MKTEIIKFKIHNELDIVLAHKRAIQLCELTGISISDRTKFATAISEICRNCIEYAKGGVLTFSLQDFDSSYLLEANITDKGPGIANLELLLKKNNPPSSQKGQGIINSKKLADIFDIQTSTKGTSASLGMKVPLKHPPINKTIIQGWTTYFENEIPVSPYEEIKKQNARLLEVTEQLKFKNFEAENQIAEIKTLNNKLQRANTELENFAYTLSHDLKSPLNNLKMLVTLINKATTEEKKRDYLTAIDYSVEKLDQTLNGLVEIIESQNTKNEAVKMLFFEDIFETVKEQLKIEIDKIDVSFIVELGESTIRYFEVYLYSILLNLLSNAIKYRIKERPLSIELRSFRNDDFIILTFKDNGQGMNLAKIKNNLFKPFTRFNKTEEGRGIGLHLVKSVVEKNEGKIEVESEPGVGTTFKLYLKEYV